MVYGREVHGRPLTFMHSGKLWHDALVLEDRENGTLWSQATGEAITGLQSGTPLERLPAELTTWEDWLAQHPGTLALPGPRRRALKMRLYPRTNRMLGIIGTRNPDPRLPGKTRVVGFADGDDAVAVALSRQRRWQEARLTIGGRHVVVRHAGGRGPTRAFESSGPPRWVIAEELPVQGMYWFVWSARYPGSRIVEPRFTGE